MTDTTTLESAPDLPSQLAVKVMHEIGSNDPDIYGRLQETLNAALAAAPQTADRMTIIEIIAEADDKYESWHGGTWATAIADALLARGLRLPADETMAWAVVGEDGEVIPGSIYPTRDEAERVCDYEGERVVRVTIRVVEGGDDAA